MDGLCNNFYNLIWGVLVIVLQRMLFLIYENGFNILVGKCI